MGEQTGQVEALAPETGAKLPGYIGDGAEDKVPTLTPPPADPKARGPFAALQEAMAGVGLAKIAETPDGDDPDATSRLIAKCRAFLDPNLPGPIFISKPHRSHVYVGLYPKFGEGLEATRVMGAGAEPENAVANIYKVVGDLIASIKGYVKYGSPDCEYIMANHTTVTPDKWLSRLTSHAWLQSRDPYIFKEEIFPLWTEYMDWLAAVTPSPQELEKYYSLI